MKPGYILIIDDEVSLLKSLRKVFEKDGYAVFTATSATQGLEILRSEAVDLALCDLMMPGMSGVDFLKASKAIAPEVVVILITAFGTIERAVEAMREGAYDFITKPIKRANLLNAVHKAMDHRALVAENRSLKAKLAGIEAERTIIGRSPAFRQVLTMAKQVASSQTTVLIQGESGTGKELIARLVHEASPRHDGPFVAINCAALPESILESELFGYERGAFTGAVKTKPGRFELSDGGTLFLDEVGELTPSTQVKLLRVLQEGEFERLGGTSSIRVSLRVIAATNKDLDEEVEAGRFRKDLYYRLNVIRLELPPLRARTEDIPLLVNYFVRLYSQKNDKPEREVTPEAMSALTDYSWPGNVRELMNVCERAVVLSQAATIGLEDLPPTVGIAKESRRTLEIPIGTPLSEIERRVIAETLNHTGGDKRLAAQLLGIATRTIYRKI